MVNVTVTVFDCAMTDGATTIAAASWKKYLLVIMNPFLGVSRP